MTTTFMMVDDLEDTQSFVWSVIDTQTMGGLANKSESVENNIEWICHSA